MEVEKQLNNYLQR